MSVYPARLTMPMPWLKKLGLGLTICGPYAFVALAMVDKGAICQQAISQVVAWGPATLILIGVYLIIERWAPRLVAAQTEQASASRELADSVRVMVQRDDRDTREMQLMLKYTTGAVEELHTELRAMREELRHYAHGK